MNERAQRVILFLFVSFLFAMYWKSHGSSPSETPMAFVFYPSGELVARIEGDVCAAGIYKLYDGGFLMTASNLTVLNPLPTNIQQMIFQRKLPPNCVINIRNTKNGNVDITVKPMNFKDRLLLGIRLDPNRLIASEWEILPGIGPSLAQEIIKNRQINGAYGSVQSLTRVPGMSKHKVSTIMNYF